MVNEPRLLASRYHIDWKTEHLCGPLQEDIAVARLAQRLSGYGTHLVGRKSCQALTKSRQTVPSALHRRSSQIPVVVQPGALTNRFLDVFRALKSAVVDHPNLQAKAVGPQVDGREAIFSAH